MPKFMLVSIAYVCMLCAQPLLAEDCNNNGFPDDDDIQTGRSEDCNNNLIPDECDIVAQNFGFDVATTYPAGIEPIDVAIGDYNEDTYPDIAVPNECGNDVYIFINNGDGTFTQSASQTVGDYPQTIVAAHLDGDTHLDLATANFFGDDVSVLFGVGDGTFEAALSLTAGSGPQAVDAADLDGDTFLDLIVANFTSGDVSVLNNNGDRTFAPAVHTATGLQPFSVSTGNLVGDSSIDVLVANRGSDVTSVLRNDSGALTVVLNLAGVAPADAVPGLLDDDELLDIAVANRSDDSVSVYINNGDDTFSGPTDYTVGSTPQFLISADLDNDSADEIIVSNFADSSVSVLKNDGAGVFTVELTLGVGTSPSGLGVGIFDTDSLQDLVVANQGSDTISVFLNQTEPAVSEDCNDNEIPDECDISSGTSEDCNTNNIPDECESQDDCNSNLIFDICDISSGTSEDCNNNVIPDECEVPPIGPAENDCNTNLIPDDCDIDQGTSLDCNANDVPDECELDDNDCNTNLIPDDCDISSGTSEDCNTNLVPDECELDDNDCNTNLVPDDCDISSGTSEDCDLDLIPDECEPFLLQVVGYTSGSVTQDTTLGGATIMFDGDGFSDGMTVRFESAEFSQTVDAVDVTSNTEGTELTVVVPAFAPGCECSNGLSIMTNVVFDNGCEEVDLFFSSGELFQYDIHSVAATDEFSLQADIDVAAPGTCLTLTADVNYEGPLTIDALVDRITIAGGDPVEPGRTQIDSDLLSPVMTFDGHGPGVCVSHVNLLLGNSGALIKNSATPILKHCNIDSNFADASHGGGLTVTTSAHPIVYDCTIAINETLGSGGGIYVDGADLTLFDSLVFSNSATLNGGGVYLQDTTVNTTLMDNWIAYNQFMFDAVQGGGVYWVGTQPGTPALGILYRNDISFNDAQNEGAGVFVGVDAGPDVSFNDIYDNLGQTSASIGGGLYVADFNRESFSICENSVYGNSAQVGGGLALMTAAEALIDKNIVFCNSSVQLDEDTDPPSYYAAGLYLKGSGSSVTHNTLYMNTGAETATEQGGGIHGSGLGSGFPQFWDNVIDQNTGYEVFSDVPLFGNVVDWNLANDPLEPLEIFSSLIMNLGANNLIGDPILLNPSCDPANAWVDFGLTAGSPGIGSASDGFNRGAVITTGYVPGQCATTPQEDCDLNGIPDDLELLFGLAIDLDYNGIPDVCTNLPIKKVIAVPVAISAGQIIQSPP